MWFTLLMIKNYYFYQTGLKLKDENLIKASDEVEEHMQKNWKILTK